MYLAISAAMLGETVVGVVNGVTAAGQDALTITTGVLGDSALMARAT